MQQQLLQAKDNEGERIFFVIAEHSHDIVERNGRANHAFQRMMHLGPHDILHLPKDKLDTIPLGPPVPSALYATNYRAVLNTTGDGSLWLIENNLRRRLPGVDALKYFGFSVQNVTTIATHWIDFFPIGDPVPDIYSENSLIRFHKAKEVFVVKDGRRHSIPNAGIFFKYGWDFDNVRVVVDEADMNRIPYGDPMTRRLMRHRK